MRSTSRAASMKRFAELRIIFRFFEFEPERSSRRTRSNGASAAAKNEISWGTPSSSTTKSFCCSSGAGVFAARPRTLTFKSTRSESMRTVSIGSCARISPATSSRARQTKLTYLIRIVATLAARHGVRPVDVDVYSSPTPVTRVVCRTIGQTVNRSEVGDNLFVSTGEIRETFDLIENSSTCISHLLHPILAHVESFGLRIERAHRL